MISQFDLENARTIVDGYGDWYGAMLLRCIAEASPMDRGLFYMIYPEETQAILNLDLPDPGLNCTQYRVSFDQTLRDLYRKADAENKRLLESAFSRFTHE